MTTETAVRPSSRERLQLDFIEWLRESETWTAPYGILDSMSSDKKYRSVTFGIARALDAEVRIYSTHYITLRSSRDGWMKFESLSALKNFLKETYRC